MAGNAIFPLAIYNSLKTVLSDAAGLDYVDTIVIEKFRYAALPKFTHHAIVISPMSALSQPSGQIGHRHIENEIQLALLVKPVYGNTDAIIGNDTKTGDPLAYGFDPPKIGLLRFYEDVFKTLYGNTLSNEAEITPGMGELDNRSDFFVLMDDDREEFLLEAKMMYRPRGHRFYGLP